MHRHRFALVGLLLIAAMVLTACPQPEAVIVDEGDTAATTEDSSAASSDAEAAPDNIVAGGTWTRSSSSDATILNPILGSDSASSDIYGQLYPSLIGQDPFSGELVAGFGSLADSIDVSDDGLVYTFNLRDDMFWSDGEQVDANDFKYTYDAVASDNVETVRKPNVEFIDNIEVVDDFTVEVTFSQVKCDAIGDVGLGILPSHIYAEDFSDIMTSPENEAPTVSAGPMKFQSWTRDDNTILVRNDDYVLGAPNLDGMIYRIVPDPGARLAQLQSGEVDITGLQPEQVEVIESDPNLNVFNAKDDGYTYIGLNLANPDNPQLGEDEDGNIIEQEPHPILSDQQVRLAMAHALDYQTIIDNVYLGQGYPIASNVLPAVSWAYDDSIQPYEYDPELAMQILEDAGYVDSDGDGVRETPDGEPLALSLMTNAGNTTREDLGVLVQDQLNNVGFDIDFQAIDFGTMVGQMLDQTYDMVIIGWTGLGSDPNDDSFWHSRNDTPGSGFNFTSYSNPEIDELLEQGVSVPGCAVEDRAPYYQQIQQIIHDDIPYLFVTGSIGNTGYSDRFAGIDPGEWSFYWNEEAWYQKSLQP